MPELIEGYHGLIGRSVAMQPVYDRIAKFGPPGIPVLILGETGTGKDLCARALWLRAAR